MGSLACFSFLLATDMGTIRDAFYETDMARDLSSFFFLVPLSHWQHGIWVNIIFIFTSDIIVLRDMES